MLSDALQWFLGNKVALVATIPVVITALQAVTRLTPTEKDNEFMDRVADGVAKVFGFFGWATQTSLKLANRPTAKLLDVLNVPNRKKGGGVHSRGIIANMR